MGFENDSFVQSLWMYCTIMWPSKRKKQLPSYHHLLDKLSIWWNYSNFGEKAKRMKEDELILVHFQVHITLWSTIIYQKIINQQKKPSKNCNYTSVITSYTYQRCRLRVSNSCWSYLDKFYTHSIWFQLFFSKHIIHTVQKASRWETKILLEISKPNTNLKPWEEKKRCKAWPPKYNNQKKHGRFFPREPFSSTTGQNLSRTLWKIRKYCYYGR